MPTEKLIEELKEQLAALEREFRQELPRKIKAARELGDLRENAEYEAAKARQGFVKARMDHLRQRIAVLSRVNLNAIPRDRVGYGTTVSLVDLDSAEEKTYKLVSPEEMDSERGWISVASPVGQALVGKRAGDAVTITTPGGTRQYEIAEVKTLHDELAEDTGIPGS